jgi:hypothetical protein
MISAMQASTLANLSNYLSLIDVWYLDISEPFFFCLTCPYKCLLVEYGCVSINVTYSHHIFIDKFMLSFAYKKTMYDDRRNARGIN